MIRLKKVILTPSLSGLVVGYWSQDGKRNKDHLNESHHNIFTYDDTDSLYKEILKTFTYDGSTIIDATDSGKPIFVCTLLFTDSGISHKKGQKQLITPANKHLMNICLYMYKFVYTTTLLVQICTSLCNVIVCTNLFSSTTLSMNITLWNMS